MGVSHLHTCTLRLPYIIVASAYNDDCGSTVATITEEITMAEFVVVDLPYDDSKTNNAAQSADEC